MRNLHRYQNQGWEAYNQQVAAFWHHRTQKGGRSGSNNCDRSKIKPIARWILRMLLWRTGEGQRYFEQKEREKNRT